MPILPFAPLPDPAVDRQRGHDRRHPERATLELAAAGAAKVLGADHGVTRALARASTTMGKADLWQARLALKCCAATSARPLPRRRKAKTAGLSYSPSHGKLYPCALTMIIN